jgi:pyridoxal phosphate enzyme (YggS family)
VVGSPLHDVAVGLAAVRARIAAACRACGRDPTGVQLLAVSKAHPAAAVRAALAAGQRTFGENRVQELERKAAELSDLPLRWHLVGSLQTNKVRDLLQVPGLELVHSLDRPKLADALQAECERAGRDLDVLLQINATGETRKHGVLPEHSAQLVEHALRHRRLRLRGVMAMGPLQGDPTRAFATAAGLRDDLARRFALELPVLSLGMSDDLEAAIAAGSTLVRVGTAVFGPRQ